MALTVGGRGQAWGMTGEMPQALRELAELQRGVVSRKQALDAGLSADSIRGRVRGGRWRQLQLGVYATFTGDPGRGATLWAAVLRAGPNAVLSHQTAAELHNLTERRWELVHVTLPRNQRMAPTSGVIVHRSSRVAQARHPAMTPPRTRVEETVIDLTQASAGFDEAFNWLCRGVACRLTTVPLLRAALDARPRARWRAEILGALADIAEGVRSPLERRYVRNVERAHGLPEAKRQVAIVRGLRTSYIDNLYEEYDVAVELDGRAAHPVEERFNDIRRDNANAVGGITTLRYGWGDVTERACGTASQVGDLLRRGGWRGVLRRCGPGCRVRSQ